MKPSAAVMSTNIPDHEASNQARAHRSRRQAAFQAAVRWLRRACADWARAWALAAGVPPNLDP